MSTARFIRPQTLYHFLCSSRSQDTATAGDMNEPELRRWTKKKGKIILALEGKYLTKIKQNKTENVSG